MSKKDMKISVVSYQQTQEEDFKAPAKWYFVSATGDWVFIHCRNRKDAISYVNSQWNGKYNIRCSTQDKGSGEISAKGYMNSKSRAGSRPVY